MTITSDELNYLIWRYFQEQGLEVSLYALQDETSVAEYDERYNAKIPIGCLINLIQKGILYCEEDELVNSKGETVEAAKKFNLFDALEKDKLNNPTTKLEPTTTTTVTVVGEDNTTKEPSPAVSETFTTILTKSFTFPKSQTNDWNPRSSAVLAWGQRDSTSMITVLNDSSSSKQLQSLSSLKLEHPSISSFVSSNDITLVEWSTNGDMLLTASETGELRLWTTDGKLKNVMMLHNLPIITIKWFNDLILTKDFKKTIVWDSKSGLALSHLEDTQGGIDGCFIDENKIAIPSSDHSILIYDLLNQVPLSKLNGHTGNISLINYNRSLKLLLTVSDDLSIRIWKGESINSTQILMGHSQLITFCHWLPSGEFLIPNLELLISTSLDGSIRIWNVYNGDLLFIATNAGGVSILQASVSPDNKWLATGDVDGVITIWDISISSLNGNYQKRKLNKIGNVKNVSQYQPDLEKDGNFVSCINWSQDSKKIAISYSEIDSVVICI